MKYIKKTAKRSLINFRGWRTNRKIIVIESDDWGAIRLPSKDILDKLNSAGVKTAGDHYLNNDSLASEKDLTHLFELLSSVKNKEGESPKFTANTIMANPDFEKIRKSNFKNYHYELFTNTLKRYPEHGKSFSIWKEGMDSNIFRPQFHGREHLHVGRWLNGLKVKDSETAKSFNFELYALCSTVTTESRKSYMAAWELDNQKDKIFGLDSIKDGLSKFEELFGYRSLSAIAPNYTWDSDMEVIMNQSGVQYLQGGTVQRSPDINSNRNKIIRHFTGQQNNLGQYYMVRNCTFEPTSNPDKDWVNSCLLEIKNAFFWKKPAIIETHRVNYIGYINPENRDRNLKLLQDLLTKILKTWPDVEFMTSEQLGATIESGK